MSVVEDRLESLRLIRDSVAAIVPPGGDLRRIRALRFTEPGFDAAVQREMGELGWLGLRVSEDDGGAGLGMAELCAVAEGIGAGLVPEPLVSVAVIAPLLPEAWRTAVIVGDKVVLPAWQEKANEFPHRHAAFPQTDGTATAYPIENPSWPGLTRPSPPPRDTGDVAGDRRVKPGDDDPDSESSHQMQSLSRQAEREQVSTRKLFIPMASGADAFLVTSPAGLFLVQRDAPGVTLDLDRTQDGGHFGTLTLADTPGIPIAGSLPLDEAALATAAYLLGVMDRAFALTLDYLRTRQQFGRAIGSFQALQHRCADLRIQVALTRASVESAAATYDAHGPTLLACAAISRAKVRAAEASMLVTRQAIQLHGGIGYTDEADIGLYLRKAMVLANLYGGAAVHRTRYAALAPEQDE